MRKPKTSERTGRFFYVEAQGTTVEYNGSPHILVILHDITDRKLAEEELRESKKAAEAAKSREKRISRQ